MKRKICGILLMGMVLLLSACGNTAQEPSENDEQKQEEQQASSKLEDEKQNTDKVEVDAKDDADKPNKLPVMINVYYSNEDATAFVSEEVQVDSLTPENILSVLLSKEIVTPEVQVLNFEKVSVDGKDSIELDLNAAFADYISTMGTAGEYYILGGICNTFLDAYDCEQIKITVEGDVLTTGHAEYQDYMTMFE